LTLAAVAVGQHVVGDGKFGRLMAAIIVYVTIIDELLTW